MLKCFLLVKKMIQDSDLNFKIEDIKGKQPLFITQKSKYFFVLIYQLCVAKNS